MNDTRIRVGEMFSLVPAEIDADADTDVRYRIRLGGADPRYFVFYAQDDDEAFASDLGLRVYPGGGDSHGACGSSRW
ncbi:hypothetical protein [Microbacterium trichothecenolyticum]|uniref:Uncharacterized protein n=1 Tax=Microbacterium trichothecenolyticum TaxID=69370 RepID=A0ABU0TUY4_MICTR|nr:hypothetical protein [Microbacterium trichothecenolyticum]MDQ1123466.1 hypothetical protein [Microbacterium trichothecenolyticum]